MDIRHLSYPDGRNLFGRAANVEKPERKRAGPKTRPNLLAIQSEDQKDIATPSDQIASPEPLSEP